MKILLKAVQIYDPTSSFHLKRQHVLIDQGMITYIGDDLQEADRVLDMEGLCVSTGWVDMYAQVGEPGLEHKEDIESLSQAAAAGGFTDVLCMPNVQPVVQSKGAINFLKSKSAALPVNLLPAGAVTVDTQGKELTEMIDLQRAGAMAFTDGDRPLQGAEVIVKALQYLQPFGGLLMNRPEHTRLTEFGQIHEGLVSTQLGMKGIPALAEEVMVTRDLQLLAYTGGRLHFSLISSAGSVEAIRQAKAAGLDVTCDVASYQVAYTDETMAPFDTNYKVSPPFRSHTDAEAIKQGLQDGTIDAVVSAHQPHDTESKKLEFDLAEFGIINLETAFAVANTTMAGILSLENLIEKLTSRPREILRLPACGIAKGAKACLTLFHPKLTWRPTQHSIKSKSTNSPFLEQELTGKVIGIINKGQLVLNHTF
ncbi:dihydroorotase [Pontibacter sp. JH31]|uniref:Dihydroorotase n=1 Tax=Pontibacter aquaedesilientis TaxID=2766980 RepID=A0ABR7XKI3_9BACT|nr:dihydroorotase [Pontibacter aquaedesilientis]MBD1398785.1 dihydroorotase [Pontibacter aquaedesilientis]